jgi:hypothetical protein
MGETELEACGLGGRKKVWEKRKRNALVVARRQRGTTERVSEVSRASRERTGRATTPDPNRRGGVSVKEELNGAARVRKRDEYEL